MSQAALNGLEQTSGLRVAGWDFDLDELVVVFGGAVGLAVGSVVEESSDILSQTVTHLAQLLAVAVDFVRIFAVHAVLGVDLEVVGGPRLVHVDGSADGADGVLEEAHSAVLLGARRGLGVDDGRHGVLAGEGRHDDDGSVLQDGSRW